MAPLLPALLGPTGRYLAAGVIALSAAGALIGVGIRYERAQNLVAVARAEKAEADATRLAATAEQNAKAAMSLAKDNEAQALAYAADAEQARADADQIKLARQAAAIASHACAPAPEPTPLVHDQVHNALNGRAVSEDDELAPSMRAATEALRTKPKGRRK